MITYALMLSNGEAAVNVFAGA